MAWVRAQPKHIEEDGAAEMEGDELEALEASQALRWAHIGRG